MPVEQLTKSRPRVFDEVFDSQAIFRTILLAMARPGSIGGISVSDPRCPLPSCQVVAGILRTLLSHEVSFAVVPGLAGNPTAATELGAYLAEATGGQLCPIEAADYVVLLGAPPGGLFLSLRRGQPAYPDESATLIASLPSFAPGSGVSLALAGPGVTPGTRLELAGWSAQDVATMTAVNAEPPLGIDLILATPHGQVACIPRSIRLTLNDRD
jgi:alpha-D-ribose 1-methylphosphonate 5-triphosphate synthase subunit PhnH